MTDELDKDENGNVVLRPVTGWTPYVGYGMMCCLRIDLDPAPASHRGECDETAKSDAVQIALTPEQARLLGRVLTKLAEVAEAKPEASQG